MALLDDTIIELIEMKMIRPSNFAVRNRFHEMAPAIEELKASIQNHGLLQPMVRPSNQGYEIVAGHRRYQACRCLHWRYIFCKVCDLADSDAYEIQLTENIQRKSMEPLEEAEAFRKYVIEFGWGGVSQLARRIGKSEEYVSQRINMLRLPDKVKERLAEKTLSVSQALELVNLPAGSKEEITAEVLDGRIPVKKIREMKKAASGARDIALTESHARMVSRAAKKTYLHTRVQLKRIDDLLEEINRTVEDPDQKKEITDFLMSLRLKIHSMMNEIIRFQKTCGTSA